MDIQKMIHDIKNDLALPLFGLERDAEEADKLRGRQGIDNAVTRLDKISAHFKKGQDEVAGD